jgi:hypothetical protein
MAPISGVASFQALDADGNLGSIELPFTCSTGLLADITSWLATITPSIDVVIEGQILKIRLSINIPLPVGLKSAPQAGSNLQETALFNEDATGTLYSYGVDMPSFKQSLFVGGRVDSAAVDVIGFEAVLHNAISNCKVTDKYGNALSATNRGYKTFRKYGKRSRK